MYAALLLLITVLPDQAEQIFELVIRVAALLVTLLSSYFSLSAAG